eukprot:1394761-Amorphochlora_amoeboformis.AAC.2
MQSSLWVWVIWVGMAASTTPTRMVRGRSSAIGRAKSHTLRFTATNGAFQTKRGSRANTPPRTSRALANAEGKEESPQGLTIDPDEVSGHGGDTVGGVVMCSTSAGNMRSPTP